MKSSRWIATLIGGAAVLTASLIVSPSAEAQSGPYAFYPLSPCRLVDTRLTPGVTGNQGQTGWSGHLPKGQITFVTVKGFCGVPATNVNAVSMNITVVSPGAQGHVRIIPADAAALGKYSTLNFLSTDFAITNGAIAPIKSSGTATGPAGPTGGSCANVGIGDLGFFYGTGGGANPCDGTHLDLVIDITGYFSQ
jgi:hypothetical protein